MKVVLAGSRKLAFLPNQVKSTLEELLEIESEFLVGDAPGIDTTFQSFLANRKYKFVKVYSSANYVRNNVGRWESELIETTLKSITSSRHAFKDREMCLKADIGIFVWDQESAGTLSNAIDLLEQGKTCWMYNVLDDEFVRFESIQEFNEWLSPFQEVAEEARQRLRRYRNRKKDGTRLQSLQSELF
jgi:hypothetical protein